MSERARHEDAQERSMVTRSVLGPDHWSYAIDDDVVVAEVRGASVQLFDGFGLLDILTCETSEQAEQAALQYAHWWMQAPVEAER